MNSGRTPNDAKVPPDGFSGELNRKRYRKLGRNRPNPTSDSSPPTDCLPSRGSATASVQSFPSLSSFNPLAIGDWRNAAKRKRGAWANEHEGFRIGPPRGATGLKEQKRVLRQNHLRQFPQIVEVLPTIPAVASTAISLFPIFGVQRSEVRGRSEISNLKSPVQGNRR